MKNFLLFLFLSTLSFASPRMVPATIESVTYDSRVGGVQPPPNTPRPTPEWIFEITVPDESCFNPKNYRLDIQDQGGEYYVSVLEEIVTTSDCLPGNWQYGHFGRSFTKRVQGLKRGVPMKLVNPLFIKTALPRP